MNFMRSAALYANRSPPETQGTPRILNHRPTNDTKEEREFELNSDAADRFEALHARVADPVSAYHAQACRKGRRRESDRS